MLALPPDWVGSIFERLFNLSMNSRTCLSVSLLKSVPVQVISPFVFDSATHPRSLK